MSLRETRRLTIRDLLAQRGSLTVRELSLEMRLKANIVSRLLRNHSWFETLPKDSEDRDKWTLSESGRKAAGVIA